MSMPNQRVADIEQTPVERAMGVTASGENARDGACHDSDIVDQVGELIGEEDRHQGREEETDQQAPGGLLVKIKKESAFTARNYVKATIVCS